MEPDLQYPALSDLRAACKRRVPGFVWEYLASATGTEAVIPRNRAALDAVLFRPAILRGPIVPDLCTTLLGDTCAAPFGIAPVGMSGLIWPGAEEALARFAAQAGIPYTLSTVATRLPEQIGPLVGGQGWFQLYPPRDPDIRRDMLRRARGAGFRVLVLTADLPGPSRRERQLRARLTLPPRVTARMLAQVALRPAWALGTLRHGRPRLALMESYARAQAGTSSVAHIGYQLRAAPDWDYLRALRDEWAGPLVVKGVMDPDDARPLRAAGVDALWVSNHGGRQFDGAPAALDLLPAIRQSAGPDLPILFDGGVESGLDVLRALALGADFVMLGRGWHFALGALGALGPAHLFHILTEDMKSCMTQMGIVRPDQALTRLHGRDRM